MHLYDRVGDKTVKLTVKSFLNDGFAFEVDGVKWDDIKEMNDTDADDSFSDSERDNYNTLGFADHGGCIILNEETILSQRDRRHK